MAPDSHQVTTLWTGGASCVALCAYVNHRSRNHARHTPWPQWDAPTRSMVCDRMVTINRITPGRDELVSVVEVLRGWQRDDAFQLHPGDLGWFWRFDAEATARAIRIWRRDGAIAAVGLLDGPGLVRLAIAPDHQQDEELARRLASDVTRIDPDLLGPGEADLELPAGAVVDDMLAEDGWALGESWTPLRRELTEPVEEPGVQVEVVGPDLAPVRAAVQRAAFDGSTFTDRRWQAMAAGAPYRDARCLVAFDDAGAAVATITVWSAGPGRPGLIEPMGVHRDHRRQGHGVGITRAGAAALRDMGASSAMVGTPTSNAGAVATYCAAGFTPLAERLDRRRDGAR